MLARTAEVLIEAAHPKMIILFGSQSDASADSDSGVMVIDDATVDRLQEMVRVTGWSGVTERLPMVARSMRRR